MSKIPFVEQLGDALEDAIAAHIQGRTPSPRRLRTTLRRGRVLVALGVVLVGGGVATAAILDQTTTVAAGLSCIAGTSGQTSTIDAYNVSQSGDSPTAACAAEMGVPAAKLIACAKPVEGVVVFEADSDPADQCRSLGMTPLPTDYTAAINRVHELEHALTADYERSDCMPPSHLAQDADADLRRLGFTGWHAVIDTASAAGMEFAGPCGELSSAPLDARNQTVVIEIGASRPILRLAESVSAPIMDASGNQCYTLASAQHLVRDMLNTAAGRSVPVEFAVTRESPYTTLMGGSGGGAYADGRQTYYDKGCTVVVSLGTAPNGRTFLATLQNDAGPADPHNLPPAVGNYRPNLTNG